MDGAPATTYPEFWPRYLRAHGKPATRWLHFIGGVLALAFLVAAALTPDRRRLLAAPLIGYGFSWAAHFGVEGNRPETFGHPVWSLLSDFRMLGLWLTGRLGPHLERARHPEQARHGQRAQHGGRARRGGV